MPIIHNNIRSMADYKYLSFEPVPAGIKVPVFNGDITPPSAGSPLRAEPVAFLLESFLERLKIGGFKNLGLVHPELYTFSWKLKSLRSGYTLAFNPLGRNVSRWGSYTQLDDSNIGNYGYWSDVDKVTLFSNVVSLCFTDETERMNDTINNALWPENWHLTKDVISHIPLNEIYYAYSLAKSNIAFPNIYPTCDNLNEWADKKYDDSTVNSNPMYGFSSTIYGDMTTTPLGQCSFETSFAGTLKADVSLCALTLWSVDNSNYVIIPTSSITIPAGVTTATFPETWLSLAQRAKSVCPPADLSWYDYVCHTIYPVVTVTHTIFPEAV